MPNHLRVVCVVLLAGVIAACDGAKMPPSTPRPSPPAGMNLIVVGTQYSGHSATRLEVRLTKRASKTELGQAAAYLHDQHGAGRPLTQVFFYLPLGSIGDAPAWARASAPNGDVSVIGMTQEQEARLRALPPPEGTLIGSWLDDGPPSRRLSVVRRGPKLFVLREFETGTSAYQLREGKAEHLEVMRLHYRDPEQVQHGEYLVIRPDGHLEGFDKEGRVFGAEKVDGS